MNCFMFPGQPLALGAPFPDDRDGAQLAEVVRDITGLELGTSKWLAGEGSEALKLQVVGVARSLYALRRLRQDGIAPDLVIEHSMGIYAALAACGSISEGDAIEITWRIGAAMAAMGARESYSLGCIIGLTEAPVLELAANCRVHLANHNTSRHFLLCGRSADIESSVAEAQQRGAFSVRTFHCDAPLHTPLIAPLEQEFASIFADYRYREPISPLLDHLDQRRLTAATIIPFLLRELSLPVYWEKTFRCARQAGGRTFHEVGMGDALRKYNRWIEAEL